MLNPIMFSTKETLRVFSDILPRSLENTPKVTRLSNTRYPKTSPNNINLNGTIFSKVAHMLDGFFKL